MCILLQLIFIGFCTDNRGVWGAAFYLCTPSALTNQSTNHLVANMVVLHNVVGMSRVLKQLQSEGAVINQEILAGLAPYRLEHINRFGDYVQDFRRKVETLGEGFRILEGESISQDPWP